jgi:hypothetical protein
MNYFNTEANGGMPVENNDLRFVDDAIREALKGSVSAFGQFADLVILSGCVRTVSSGTVTVTPGYVSLFGQILYFAGQSYAFVEGANEVMRLRTVFLPGGEKVYLNGAIVQTWERRTVEIYVTMEAPEAGQARFHRNFGPLGIPAKSVLDFIKDNTNRVVAYKTRSSKSFAASEVTVDDLEHTITEKGVYKVLYASDLELPASSEILLSIKKNASNASTFSAKLTYNNSAITTYQVVSFFATNVSCEVGDILKVTAQNAGSGTAAVRNNQFEVVRIG